MLSGRPAQAGLPPMLPPTKAAATEWEWEWERDTRVGLHFNHCSAAWFALVFSALGRVHRSVGQPIFIFFLPPAPAPAFCPLFQISLIHSIWTKQGLFPLGCINQWKGLEWGAIHMGTAVADSGCLRGRGEKRAPDACSGATARRGVF